MQVYEWIYCFQDCYDTVRNFPITNNSQSHEINKVILRVELIILGQLCFGKVSTVMFQRCQFTYETPSILDTVHSVTGNTCLQAHLSVKEG
jgi:hypothetical protein